MPVVPSLDFSRSWRARRCLTLSSVLTLTLKRAFYCNGSVYHRVWKEKIVIQSTIRAALTNKYVTRKCYMSRLPICTMPRSENDCFYVDPHHLMVPVRCPLLLQYWSVTSFFVDHHHHLGTMDADGDQYLRHRPGHRHH